MNGAEWVISLVACRPVAVFPVMQRNDYRGDVRPLQICHPSRPLGSVVKWAGEIVVCSR